jgi:hypothetical protein
MTVYGRDVTGPVRLLIREASGPLRGPEPPTLTAPPSLPAVRVGTLDVAPAGPPR